MPDLKAEIRVQSDDSSTGDIYHQFYSVTENERTETFAEMFSLSASASHIVCSDNFTQIQDISIFSNTTSQITLVIGSTMLTPIQFIEHFSIQSTNISGIKIDNLSSVTGTYKIILGGQ